MDEVFDYAARGWRVVPLGNRGEKGKIPRIRNWGEEATTDEEVILKWLDDWPDMNVGIVLGPTSGIIDVEFDSDEGRKTADKIFGEVYTPTFTSARSTHRIFAYDPIMPPVAKRVIEGLEFRLGGGERAAQSVFPPSWHQTGSQYRWKPGLSPSEVDVAKLPKEALALLHNQEPPQPEYDLTQVPKGRRVLVDPVTLEGDRDNTLLSFANRLAARSPNINDHREQGDILTIVQAVNATKVQPPLPDADIRRIVSQAVSWTGRRAAAMGKDSEAPVDDGTPTRAQLDGLRGSTPERFMEYGLEWNGNQCMPGNWRLTVIHSDPKTYRLDIPAFADLCAEKELLIPSAEFYSDHRKIAQLIHATTGCIIVDFQPGEWSAIWNGKGGKNPTIGLKALLLNDQWRRDEYPSNEDKRYVQVIETFLNRLGDPDDAEEVDPDGQPVRLPDGSIWFSWRKLLGPLITRKDLTEMETRELRKNLGIKDSDHSVLHRKGGGRNRRYTRLRPEAYKRAEEIISGRPSDEQA